MGVAGGMRFRLIRDNFENMLRSSLDDLGWFDSARNHAPVTLVSSPLDFDSELQPNLIGISPEDMIGTELELGSNLEELKWDFYIDIFAESDAVGLHLVGDIQDILKGKMNSIGRTRPSFSVLDLAASSPSHLFYCHLENIEFSRQRNYGKRHMQYWWTLYVAVIDTYYDEGEI